jgi:MFS family permease
MSLWFVSAAVLTDMLAEMTIPAARQAALSSAVQLGFVVGAMASAFFGLADRYDPRRVLMFSATAASICNAALIWLPIGGNGAISMRFLTGALLAGVYPVAMKIVVGWGQKDRGFLVGILVAALTFGSALPHAVSILGGADWRITVAGASVVSFVAGLVVLGTQLGPFHAQAARFNPHAITLAWTNRPVRYAIGGYLGHMWELYAMWAWIGAASAAAYSLHLPADQANQWSKITAFLAIAAGALACAPAGKAADKFGKSQITIVAMVCSACFALLSAVTFGVSPWVTLVLAILWGVAIIPDSAQFSALVADHAPPEFAGSLMTLQTALGFALTVITVQATPILADFSGWRVVLAVMALGPIFGIWSMRAFQISAK